MRTWPRSDKIALYSFLAAVVGILVAMLTVPEFRKMFGLQAEPTLTPREAASKLNTENQSDGLGSKVSNPESDTGIGPEELSKTDLLRLKTNILEISAPFPSRGINPQIKYEIYNESDWTVKEIFIELTLHDTPVNDRRYRLELESGSTGEQYKTSKYISDLGYDPSRGARPYYATPSQYAYRIVGARGIRK